MATRCQQFCTVGAKTGFQSWPIVTTAGRDVLVDLIGCHPGCDEGVALKIVDLASIRLGDADISYENYHVDARLWSNTEPQAETRLNFSLIFH